MTVTLAAGVVLVLALGAAAMMMQEGGGRDGSMAAVGGEGMHGAGLGGLDGDGLAQPAAGPP